MQQELSGIGIFHFVDAGFCRARMCLRALLSVQLAFSLLVLKWFLWCGFNHDSLACCHDSLSASAVWCHFWLNSFFCYCCDYDRLLPQLDT